jgi:hypothetical protein
MICQPSFRYINEFLGLHCAPDYLAARVLPGAQAARTKELSEVMGAFAAVRTAVGAPAFGARDTLLIDVGCGVVPRAATLFALMTRWLCAGVDLNVRRWPKSVSRVLAYKKTFEDFVLNLQYVLYPQNFSRIVVVSVHGHAPLWPSLDILKEHCEKLTVVSIPCCYPDKAPVQPDREYDDLGILSPKRRVYVWNNLNSKECKNGQG